jgi:hypothetical protein
VVAHGDVCLSNSLWGRGHLEGEIPTNGLNKRANLRSVINGCFLWKYLFVVHLLKPLWDFSS